MRPIRRTTGIARRLRGLALRVHRRTEPLPQLPFGIAVGVAILLLLIAIDTGPRPDTTVSDVDEVSFSDEGRHDVYDTEPAELEIVEFGFGSVVDPQGQERLSLGAIVRNPHGTVVMPSTLAVMSTEEDGTPFTLEQIYLEHIPAASSVSVGYVLLQPADGIDEDTLDLVAENTQRWAPSDTAAESPPFDWGAWMSQAAVVDIEPMFSPEGYRISYRVEARERPEQLEAVRIAIVFRDGGGTIVGGLPGWGDPFDDPGGVPGFRPLPPGGSLQYLDLPAASIPEGADLNQLEIGPGV